MGMPYEEGTLLYHSGLATVAAGDRQTGRQQLAEALDIFQRLGAAPYIERTEQAMAATDPPPQQGDAVDTAIGNSTSRPI
jgi:hypothetical protein